MPHIGSIEDVVKRFRSNWKGYVHEYRFFLVLMAFAGLADMGSTIYFMLQKGVDCEAHPAVRLVSMVFGPILGPIIGKACQFLAVITITVFLRRRAVYIFLAVIILYLWAAWYNISGLTT